MDPFASERVPEFKFWSCPGPFVLGVGGGKTLVWSVAGGQSSLLRTCFSLVACSFSLLSLKNNSVPLKQNRTILSQFYGYKSPLFVHSSVFASVWQLGSGSIKMEN